jgi:hypothetical protein
LAGGWVEAPELPDAELPASPEFCVLFFLFFFLAFLPVVCVAVESSEAMGAPWFRLGESEEPVVEEPWANAEPGANVIATATSAIATVKIAILITFSCLLIIMTNGANGTHS